MKRVHAPFNPPTFGGPPHVDFTALVDREKERLLAERMTEAVHAVVLYDVVKRIPLAMFKLLFPKADQGDLACRRVRYSKLAKLRLANVGYTRMGPPTENPICLTLVRRSGMEPEYGDCWFDGETFVYDSTKYAEVFNKYLTVFEVARLGLKDDRLEQKTPAELGRIDLQARYVNAIAFLHHTHFLGLGSEEIKRHMQVAMRLAMKRHNDKYRASGV